MVTTHEIRKFTSIVHLLIKSMKKVVVHDLTTDFSLKAKLNRFIICCFDDKIVNLRAKIARNWKIFVISIFDDIMVKYFAQW